MANSKKRRRPVLVQTIMAALCAMLALSAVLPDHSFSQTENRSLATSADFTLQALADGQTGRDLNSIVSDQIPFRTAFFHLDYLIRKAVGQREIKDVFLGKNALLANPEMPEGSVSTDNIAAISRFASLTQIPSYVLVAPSAALIQPQKLPSGAVANDAYSVIHSDASALTDSSWIDVQTPLASHTDEYLFYRTDHHWTSTGAALAAQTLLSAMGIEMNPDDFNFMQVSDSFEGTLASKTGSVFLHDSIDIAVSKNNPKYIVTWADGSKTTSIYHKDALKTKDQYQVFLSNNQAKVQIDTDLDSGRSLLLFKDSYANSLVQFLLPYFSMITVVDPRYFYDDLDTLLAFENYTDCAFVYSEDTFGTISSLATVLNSSNPDQN